MAALSNKQRHSQRTYYLHRNGSVSKTPSPSHLLRIRAESEAQASTLAWALRAKLQQEGLHLAFEEA